MLAAVIFHSFSDRFETLFIFLSTLPVYFAYNYYIIIGIKNRPFVLKGRGLAWFLISNLLTIHLFCWLLAGSGNLKLLFFQVTLVMGTGLIHLLTSKLSKPHAALRPRSVNTWYSLFFLSWLALVCIAPLITFYNDAFNNEQVVARKRPQLELARAIEERNLRIDHFHKAKTDPSDNKPLLEKTIIKRKEEGIYSWAIGDRPVPPAKGKNLTIPDLREQHHYTKQEQLQDYRLRASFDPQTAPLLFNQSDDGTFGWKIENNKLKLTYRFENTGPGPESNQASYVVIESDLHQLSSKLSGISFIVFLLILFASVLLEYMVIRLISKSVFGLNLLRGEFIEPVLLTPSKERPEDNTVLQNLRRFIHSGSHVIVQCQTRDMMNRFNAFPAKNVYAGFGTGRR